MSHRTGNRRSFPESWLKLTCFLKFSGPLANFFDDKVESARYSLFFYHYKEKSKKTGQSISADYFASGVGGLNFKFPPLPAHFKWVFSNNRIYYSMSWWLDSRAMNDELQTKSFSHILSIISMASDWLASLRQGTNYVKLGQKLKIKWPQTVAFQLWKIRFSNILPRNSEVYCKLQSAM